MGIAIRDARRVDVPDIVRLLADDALGATREQVADGDGAGALDPAYWRAFDDIEADPRQRLVVADRDGVVVGTLQLSFIPSLTFTGGERAQIEGVRVAGTERGAGIGRLMVGWCVAQARARGCRLVQLTTNVQRPDALRFYESCGFATTHHGLKLEL